MKKYSILILYIIIIIIIIACGRNNRVNNKQKQILNSKIKIDSIWVQSIKENEEYNYREFQFSMVKKLPCKININDDIDSIYFENIVGWDNEPGDFRNLKFIIDGKELNSFKNFGGWIKVPQRFHKYASNDYFLKVNLGFKNPVFIFFSYSYASEPGYLSLFTFIENEMCPIFNEKVWLKDIEILENGLNQLKVNYRAEPYILFIEGNKLKFKKAD